MKKVAKIFIIIGMICGCWLIFPIILGAKNLRRINNNIPISVHNKIMVLLFVNTVAGILLLCDHSDDAPAEVKAEENN